MYGDRTESHCSNSALRWWQEEGAQAAGPEERHCVERGKGRSGSREEWPRASREVKCNAQGMHLSASLAEFQKPAMQPPGYGALGVYLTSLILSSSPPKL